MAMSTASETRGTPAPREGAGGAPSWVLGLYLGGLFTVYLGQRVLAGTESAGGLVTGAGLVLVSAATALRFTPKFRTGGERRSIEQLLAGLSVLGLLGLVAYFTTSDFGVDKLQLDQLPSDKRTRIEEFVRVLWASLICISVIPMIFAETALRPMRSAARPEFRRVRAATFAGLSLSLAGVSGALLVYAAGGVDLKVDYSYFKTSKPSESTKKLVSSLSGDPIRVVAFYPDVNEVRPEVEGYLKQLSGLNPKLKVEVIDRLLVPKLSKELSASQDGVIVLSRGASRGTLNVGTELEQARVKLRTLDRDFQEQLLKIAKSKRTAYFTVGHGEINDTARSTQKGARGAQIVRTLLQKQNFTIKDLGLVQGLANDVPEDAEVVFVLGPTSAFAREELSALERYAARGGRLVLALDPDALANEEQLAGKSNELVTKEEAQVLAKTDTPPGPIASSSATPAAATPAPAPSFNQELAKLAGVKYQPDVLANEKQHVRVRYNDSDRTKLVSNSFSSHASVSTLSRNAPRAAVILFGAASLERLEGEKAKIDFAVRSLPNTFQDENRDYKHQTGPEKSGVFNLAAAVTRSLEGQAAAKKPEPADKKNADEKKDEAKEFRAFVLGDADAISDIVMGEVLGNQILFVDAVRWLVGEGSVQGLPNTEEDVRIEHTKQGDLGWFYALILGAPGLVLGTGLLISFRSRARGGKR